MIKLSDLKEDVKMVEVWEDSPKTYETTKKELRKDLEADPNYISKNGIKLYLGESSYKNIEVIDIIDFLIDKSDSIHGIYKNEARLNLEDFEDEIQDFLNRMNEILKYHADCRITSDEEIELDVI